MIEAGRVVAIEADALWVETGQKTTCGSCAARQGCGQSLLQQLYPARPNHLRVLITGNGSTAEPYRIGDRVEFSLPDHIIVAGSLLLYMAPVIGLLLGGLLGGYLFDHELAVIAAAFVGFFLAFAVVRAVSIKHIGTAGLQARLVGRQRGSPTATSIQLKAKPV